MKKSDNSLLTRIMKTQAYKFQTQLWAVIGLVFISQICLAQITFDELIIEENYEATMSVFAIDMDGDDDIDVLGARAGNKISYWKNDLNTGVNDKLSNNPDNSFHVYYNLSLNKIEVKFIADLVGKYQVSIADMMGRNLIKKTIEISVTGKNSFYISTAGLKKGTYIVQLRNVDTIFGIEKIIINY